MPFRISICSSTSYVKYDPRIFLLPREVAAEASEMRSVHFVKSMGLIVDIMNPKIRKQSQWQSQLQ